MYYITESENLLTRNLWMEKPRWNYENFIAENMKQKKKVKKKCWKGEAKWAKCDTHLNISKQMQKEENKL